MDQYLKGVGELGSKEIIDGGLERRFQVGWECHKGET